MLSPLNMQRLLAWQKVFGGANIRPAGHVLKLLGECIELAIAAGATTEEIYATADAEMLKVAHESKTVSGQLDSFELCKECADVALCLALVVLNNGVALDEIVALKLNGLFGRDYVADKDGVLHRRGRLVT